MEVDARARPQVLTGRLDRCVALMTAASAQALRDVAEADRKKLWDRDGATSMTSWLSARYGLAWGTAREWVRVAKALRRLPKISDAYASGKLSWDQLVPLSRFATKETDAHWARRAPSLPPRDLWREHDRHLRFKKEEAHAARRLRYLNIGRDPEAQSMWLEGSLPTEQGAALEAALSKRAEQVVIEEDVTDRQGARMADALVELVTGSGESEAAPATLVVHAGAEVLAGEEPASGPVLAETEGGHRLPSEAVRRLACDARIEWVLESGGRPVGIGRRGRVLPPQVSRLLRHRDRTCRFPGCGRKRWLQAHHLIHWADGGPTDLDTLALLCHVHHRLIHEGGWGTSGHAGNGLRFHDPHGRPLRVHPVGHRPRDALAPLRN